MSVTGLNTVLARRRTGTVEQIVIRLDPPELGTVRIALTARGDQVHVAVRAATPEARAALEAQRDKIEDLLKGEGFHLDSFDVGHRPQGEARHTGDHRRRAGRPAFTFDPPEPTPAPGSATDGALRL